MRSRAPCAYLPTQCWKTAAAKINNRGWTRAAVQQLQWRKDLRRLPIVNDAGEIAGVLTLDDFQRYFAEQSATLTGIVTKEQTRESRVMR